MVQVSMNLPVASSATHLQPVRRPGSMPTTFFSPSGACSSRLRRFCAKISTAARSAFILVSTMTSISTLGAISRL